MNSTNRTMLALLILVALAGIVLAIDVTPPYFDFSATASFANNATPQISFDVKDDTAVDDATLTLLTCDDATAAHYRLDQGGTEVRDYAGGNNGTVYGATFEPSGQVDGAVQFTSNSAVNT